MNIGVRTLVDQDLRDVSATKTQTLGSVGVTADGRVFRYAQAGAVAISPGTLLVNADLDANVTNKTVAASVAVGSQTVTVNAAGAVVQDAYADGFLVANDAAGEGIAYRIVGNTGVSGAGVVTVKLAEPVRVAMTVSVSEVTLKPNTYAGVLISITDQADQAVGVSNVTIPATYYGWIQTRGECAVLADEAVTKGLALTTGTGTAGAVEALDAAGEQQIGVASEALVDTEMRAVFLQMD